MSNKAILALLLFLLSALFIQPATPARIIQTLQLNPGSFLPMLQRGSAPPSQGNVSGVKSPCRSCLPPN